MYAAVGPAFSQIKILAGLPPTASRKTLDAVVRGSVSRFFLKNGIPLAMSGIRNDSEGRVWAAAIDEPVLRAIHLACRSRGLVLKAVVPTMVALGSSLSNERVVWRDGDVAAEATITNGQLGSVRRLSATQLSEQAALQPVPELARLGADATLFADAYGAALVRRDEPLSIRSSRDAVIAERTPRWRLAIAGAAAALSLFALLIAPALSANRATARMEQQLRSLGPARIAGAAAMKSLDQVTAAMEEVAAFSASRRSMSFLLRDLAGALPQQSALTTLRVDSSSATIVAITPHASVLLQRMERVPGFVAPEIIGPVTREPLIGAEGERVMIRFRVGGPTQLPARGRPR